MYEKNNVLIAEWSKYGIPWDNELRGKLTEDLVGKPIVIYVAGLRQKIGVVRQTRLGREGIFADLVLETEEVATAYFDEAAKLLGFTEVRIMHPEEQASRPLHQDFKDLQEKLKASEDQRIALENALKRMLATEKHFVAGQDLEAGELITIKDGKAWPVTVIDEAANVPPPVEEPEAEKPKPKKPRKKKD